VSPAQIPPVIPASYNDVPGPLPPVVSPQQEPAPVYNFTVVDEPTPAPSSPLQMQVWPYLEWALQEIVVADPGLAAAPVTGLPGAPANIIRVSSGYAEKIVAFSALRVGISPVVPTRSPTAPNDVQAPWSLCRALAGYLPDGTPIIELAGSYRYFLQSAPAESDIAFLAAPPYTNATPTQQTMGSGVFSTGIYQATQPAGAPATTITF
jgi:hypothetical protein